ncbi:hypothetical protein ACWD04_31465 [Streptomyces sp. NPDC002911]
MHIAVYEASTAGFSAASGAGGEAETAGGAEEAADGAVWGFSSSLPPAGSRSGRE